MNGREPRSIRRIRNLIGLGIVLGIVLGAGLLVWSLTHRPAWWSSAGDRSPAAAAVGAGLEQALSREITLVREPGEWGFVLGEEQVNAWLVNRLEPWLESRDDLELPEDVSDPRIRFGDGWIEVGLLGHQLGVPIFSVARIEVGLEGEDLVLVPLEGRMAIKRFDREALTSLMEQLPFIDGGTIDPSTGDLRVPAVIELMDGRRVVLTEIEVASGELALRFRTQGP